MNYYKESEQATQSRSFIVTAGDDNTNQWKLIKNVLGIACEIAWISFLVGIIVLHFYTYAMSLIKN